MAHVESPSVRIESDSEKKASCLCFCISTIKDYLCCCCKVTKKPHTIVPIVPNQPIPFSDPPRPGFKMAPTPPDGKGPSIVFEEGVEQKDLPVGFHVSDLTHNHQAPFAYPS